MLDLKWMIPFLEERAPEMTDAEYLNANCFIAIAEQTSRLADGQEKTAERLDGILTAMKAMNKVETRTQIVPSEAVMEALQKIHESSHDNPKVGLSAPTA